MEIRLNKELDCVSYETAVEIFAKMGCNQDIRLGYLGSFGMVWYVIGNSNITVVPIAQEFDQEKLQAETIFVAVTDIAEGEFFLHEEKRCFFAHDKKLFHIRILENAALVEKLAYTLLEEFSEEPLGDVKFKLGLVKLRDIEGDCSKDAIQWMIRCDGKDDYAYFPLCQEESRTPKSENFTVEALEEGAHFFHEKRMFVVDYNEEDGYFLKEHCTKMRLL